MRCIWFVFFCVGIVWSVGVRAQDGLILDPESSLSIMVSDIYEQYAQEAIETQQWSYCDVYSKKLVDALNREGISSATILRLYKIRSTQQNQKVKYHQAVELQLEGKMYVIDLTFGQFTAPCYHGPLILEKDAYLKLMVDYGFAQKSDVIHRNSGLEMGPKY
ncbi:MAG: hypothetical protein R3A11_06700 [Bdellovibrionota bacterium]